MGLFTVRRCDSCFMLFFFFIFSCTLCTISHNKRHSARLLQSAIYFIRYGNAASTVGAECCCKVDHRSQTSQTHHTDIASTSLAAYYRRIVTLTYLLTYLLITLTYGAFYRATVRELFYAVLFLFFRYCVKFIGCWSEDELNSRLLVSK